MIRRGFLKGSGRKGYYNALPKDPKIHSDASKGIRQPQRLPPAILRHNPFKSVYGGKTQFPTDEPGFTRTAEAVAEMQRGRDKLLKIASEAKVSGKNNDEIAYLLLKTARDEYFKHYTNEKRQEQIRDIAKVLQDNPLGKVGVITDATPGHERVRTIGEIRASEGQSRHIAGDIATFMDNLIIQEDVKDALSLFIFHKEYYQLPETNRRLIRYLIKKQVKMAGGGKKPVSANCIICGKSVWVGTKWHRNYWEIYCGEHEKKYENIFREVQNDPIARNNNILFQETVRRLLRESGMKK